MLLQEEKGIMSLNTCPTSAVSITCLTSFKQSGKNRKVSPDVFRSQSNLKRMRLDLIVSPVTYNFTSLTKSQNQIIINDVCYFVYEPF